MQPTSPKNFEHGNPSSRAKAQVKRETEARELNIAIMPFQTMNEQRTTVAARDPVAPYAIWIIGYPVGVLRATSGSPRQNRSVIMNESDMAPLTARPSIIDIGTFLSASLTSSPDHVS
jgi:hypothetical protein